MSKQPDDNLPLYVGAIAIEVRRRELAHRLEVISSLKRLINDGGYRRRLVAEADGIAVELGRISQP